MFNSLAEPNRTNPYKLERVLFKTLEYFPSALFPKLYLQNCLKKIFKNYLDSYASYICKKITVSHVDKLSLCFLLHPVIQKHDSNIVCYPLLKPFR